MLNQPAKLIELPAPASPGAGLRLSPSQVNTLNDCPAKWYYKHALKLPDPTTPALAIGRAVDAGIAAALADPDTALATFEQAWSAAASEIKPALTSEEAQAHHARAAAYLEIWIREAAAGIGTDASTQAPLEGELGGVHVRGYADVIGETGRVIEVKTRKEKTRTLPAAYYLQAVTYGVLAEAPAVEVHVLCGTKAPGLQTYTVRITEDAERYAHTSYAMAADVIAAGVFPPRRDSPLCRRDVCPYFLHCIRDHGGEVKP